MDIYRTEEEQIAALKKWWKKNNKRIITGVVIGVAIIFGWRSFQIHQYTQAKAASNIYQELTIAERENKKAEVKTYAKQLFEQYQSTTYARYAAFFLAKYAVEEENYPAAKAHLNWLISHADQEQIQHIARLRLARVLLATGELSAATKLLNIANPGKFSASYSELKEAIKTAKEQQG